MKKKFKSMNLKQKLTVCFTIIFVLMFLLIVIACTGLNIISGKLKSFYKVSYTNVIISNQMYSNVQESLKNMLNACVIEDSNSVQQYLDLASDCLDKVQDLTNELMKKSLDDKVQLDLILNNIEEINLHFEKFGNLCKQNNISEAFNIYNNEMSLNFSTINQSISLVEEAEAKKAERLYNIANRTKIFCVIGMIVLGVINILLGRTIAVKVSRMLIQGILGLKNAAIKMKDGDFDVTFDYEGQDEIRELSEAMEVMTKNTQMIIDDVGYLLGEMSEGNFAISTNIEEHYIGIYEKLKISIVKLNHQLSEILKNVQMASNQVNIGAEQLSKSAQSLAEGATEQAGAIEKLTNNIEDISNMAEKNAKGSESAANRVEQVAKEATQGRKEIVNLINAMEKISDTSKEIEDIIVDIEDIASQTNLLSLNASIEAARAGEAGKGFAVVADQIGKLASDSAKSAVNTRELITKSLSEIESGNQITKNTVSVLEKVLDAMKDIFDIAKGFTENSNMQVEMLKQLEQGIERISTTIQINSAAAQENSATSEELTSQSISMNEMTNHFKIRDDI